jgi:RNA recognition motif-containing protein
VTGVKLIVDRSTGRSLGYGFVEMASKLDADRVIDELDGGHYDGWRLTVRAALPST